MNIFKKCRVRTALLNVMTVNRNCLCQLRGCRFGPPQTDAHSAFGAASALAPLKPPRSPNPVG